MKTHRILLGAVVAAGWTLASIASASVVTVSGFSGPWNPAVAGNPAFGIGDNTGPASLTVTAGDNITITYLSGLTGAFGGGSPSVDALGYTGLIFGSGAGFTGIGSSGTFFPSHAIDPGNTGAPIYLNALIGDFVDSSGLVLSVFATGNGPFSVTAPTGAVALQFGVNDDIFADNSGALKIDVTGATGGAIPEPATWTMMMAGFGGLGAVLRRRRRSVPA